MQPNFERKQPPVLNRSALIKSIQEKQQGINREPFTPEELKLFEELLEEERVDDQVERRGRYGGKH